MDLAIVKSRAIVGVEAFPVNVEVHLSNGLPGFTLVGLPETAVRESKERVRSAIINSALEFPQRRITVNLAPADLPKVGGRYDLAIALGILAASGQVDPAAIEDTEFLGELALDGELRGVPGTLPALLAAAQVGHRVILPAQNWQEKTLASYEGADCANNLLAVVGYFVQGEILVQSKPVDQDRQSRLASENKSITKVPQLNEIRGQLMAKRALQIAASGSHNLLFVGPPGTGKTMLANSLISLLPKLNTQQALELAAVRSVANLDNDLNTWCMPPFRGPHHSATSAALIGGGSKGKPGEISLAHHGVLFLDELTEFQSRVLEVLREPLEAGEITLSRANYRVRFPARFQLIAAMNPCPCGYAGDLDRRCFCSDERIHRYLGKVSGPLLDRFDLMTEVPRLTAVELLQNKPLTMNMDVIKQQILDCRQVQIQRAGKLNNVLSNEEAERFCALSKQSKSLLSITIEKLGYSARAYYRILKLARTIADFEQEEQVRDEDLLEAMGYRKLDRITTV